MNIAMRDVHFSYPNGVEALRGITLEIHSGEGVAIVGQNGSGKTTVAKHLNGLLRPTRGEVLIGDWNTCKHTTAQLARRVGFMFQNPDEQIFKNRVADEVAFGPRNLRLDSTEVERRVASALERTGLAGVSESHPYELLPARRKWVALASVLAMEPPILVLDEPTTGQDAHGLARLTTLVEELGREGRTIVLVTHDIDFCAEHFERVIVMGEGQMLADGERHAVLARRDLLARTRVDPPQMLRLGEALGMDSPILTVPEFLAQLVKPGVEKDYR